VEPDVHRVVLDTNIVLRGFINSQSSSGHILRACERRLAIPLLSTELMGEYRAVLKHPAVVERHPQLARLQIDASLRRLRYISDFYKSIKIKFPFPRDPNDAPLIELSIAGRAAHLITADRDLLTLMSGRDDASRRLRQRLPRLEILNTDDYLEILKE
jgi:putative PIN family toxin of toxin-antitoxin system